MGKLKNREIAIILGFLMFSAYFVLWTIDYRSSSHDNELLRKEFDLANREAMDETAEWRRRYDREAEKVGRCSVELQEFKKSLGKSARTQNKKMELLQKENMDLLDQVELLKQELETEKLRCRAG